MVGSKIACSIENSPGVAFAVLSCIADRTECKVHGVLKGMLLRGGLVIGPQMTGERLILFILYL